MSCNSAKPAPAGLNQKRSNMALKLSEAAKGNIPMKIDWQGALQICWLVLEGGNPEGKQAAFDQLKKMAQVADRCLDARNLLDECDTALAVLFIGSDHGITPQANKACIEVANKIKVFLEENKG